GSDAGHARPLPPREWFCRAWTRTMAGAPTRGSGMATQQVLDRTDVARGALDEYEAFAVLLDSLDAAAWDAPTRCEGFLVRDVAGHVVGLAEDVAKGVPGSRNAEEEAASVRGDAPARVAERLRAAVASVQPLLSALDDDTWNGPSGVDGL